MARKTTPSFIVTLPLRVSGSDEREMLVRLELARQLYNATLAEALRRMDNLRDSISWARANAMPKGEKKSPAAKLRAQAFQAAKREYQFASASLSAFATERKNEAKWNEGRPRTDPRLGAHETQKIAERAFAAADMHCLNVRGRPRFKGKHRPLHSIEGKSAGSSVVWDSQAHSARWGALTLRAIVPSSIKDRWLDQALKPRTKYARVLWRQVKGKRRWFVQLVQEGHAPRKYASVHGSIVGIDVGPSTVAVVGENASALVKLCPEVEQPWKEARTLQRALDRSRRATNPHCFNADGTYKRGARIAVRSKRYQRLRERLAETERVLAARRERSHGHLANRIVALGNVIQTEGLSHRSFQKNFGRSVKVRGAASLMSLIHRKAESAGGAYIKLNTRKLKLSQFDHCTATYTRKPLSQRWHVLGDGSGIVQRDLYSAFLAAQVQSDTLCRSQVDEAWAHAKSHVGVVRQSETQAVSLASLLADASVLPAPEPLTTQEPQHAATTSVEQRKEAA